MKSIIIFILLLLPHVSVAQTAIYNGRVYTPQSFPRGEWCSCSMCQYLRSQWAASTPVITAPKVVVQTPKVVDSEYETKYREETKTVYETQYRTETYQEKVCTGRRCYYVTKTRSVPFQVAKQVTVKVPYKAKKKAKPKPTPKVQRSSVSELIPTPLKAVKRLIDVVKPRSSDVLIDAGCGDGRFLITASETGCKAIGVEINPQIVDIARSRIKATGSDAMVLQGDALEFDYSVADIVVIYQMPDLLSDIVKRIPKGVKVASYMHEIPGVQTQEYTVEIDGDSKSIFVGVVGGILERKTTFGL